MPRSARIDVGDYVYHALNRANGRLQIFDSSDEYLQFERLLIETKELTGMRILAYTLIPNHWHLALWPRNDGDLQQFMHLLTNSHTRKVHAQTGTNGSGHLYQGRYKSFLVDSDNYLLTLIKYIERNPVRAGLVARPEDWQWGSAWIRINGTTEQKKRLDLPPTDLPTNYLAWINRADKEDDLLSIRTSVNKSVPYGRETWVGNMVNVFHLASTLRNPGRPKKGV